MSRVRQLTERALQHGQIYRDSDKQLVLKVWELQLGRELTPALKEWFLNDAIFPDSITRERRKFQEQGLYPATKEVDEARYEKFEQYKQGGML